MGFYRYYATVDSVMTELGAPSSESSVIFNFIGRASSWIEQATDVNFIPISATYYFDISADKTIFFNRPLISATSVSDVDGVLSSSDYFFYPLNLTPKLWLELKETYSWQYSSTRHSVISITGLWGYSYERYLLDFSLSSDLSASTTTVTDWTVTDLGGGLTVLIDDEQLFILSVSGNTVKLVRGVNGTTAAAHSAGTSVYSLRAPFAIEQATITLASFWYSTRQSVGVRSKTLETFSVVYFDGTVIPETVLTWLDPFIKKV